jgi:hypothetical protein
MPVARIEGRMVGSGTLGPITMELARGYWDAHADPRWIDPITYRVTDRNISWSGERDCLADSIG